MRKYRGSHVIMLVAAVLLIASCQSGEVVIAFVAPLSGPNASLGVEGRAGFELALKQLDWKGWNIKVKYLDDKARAEQGESLVREALAEGVRHFVFHTTSGAGIVPIGIATEAGAFCFSGTVSAADLSGKDDLFFRTTLPNALYGKLVADAISKEFPGKVPGVVHIGDLSNENYIRAIQASLETHLVQGGMGAPELLTFDSGKEFQALDTLRPLRGSKPDVFVLSANPINAALLAQNLRKEGQEGLIVLVPWAVNGDYIRNAGQAGEGTLGLSLVLLDDDNPVFKDFSQRFEAANGQKPGYFAQYGYEEAWVIQQVLHATGTSDPAVLAGQLRKQRVYDGLVRQLSFDEWGDGAADPLWYVVRSGAFVARD